MSEPRRDLVGEALAKWGALPRPLEAYKGARPDAPDWFGRAMAVPSVEHRVEVAGAGIEAVSWGDPGHPPLLLLHGSMAHARWWVPIAPMLAQDHYVVSISFAGMGGSDWRAEYSTAMMAREAIGVADALGLLDEAARPVVIAHSFGGKPASIIAADHGERFAGTIFVDSFIVPELEVAARAPPYRARFYDNEADALARFRLSPDQPGGEPYVLDAIARAGVVQRDGRWTWRFDPDFFTKLAFENAWDEALRSRCPLAFVRGEHSPIATRADFALLRAKMRPDSLFVEVPEAYHHVMVDQPLALTATLRAIVAGWAAAERVRDGR